MNIQEPNPEINELSSTDDQLRVAYNEFQRQMLSLGKQVNDLWQKAWQERFFAGFGKYAVNSGTYLRIQAGTPPDEFPKILEALKQSNHSMTRIEFDEAKKEFRVYTVPNS